VKPSPGSGGGLGSRTQALERLAESATHPLDLLVIGGGITGAGIALDAASRGMKVGLVERHDFASGTSSKSSKLVHGGLRYLEQREFGLIREASTERELLGRLAPHLVQPFPFVIPVSDRWLRAKFGVGLWAYDALATFKNEKSHKYLDRSETEALIPPLPRNKMRGGFMFYDSKTDDVRLVMEVLIQARRYGGTVCNHALVRDLEGSEDVCSAVIEDTVTGQVFEARARRIVAATGVWTDRIESMAKSGARSRLRPSKGVHLVFSRDKVPMAEAAAFIPDADRKRMLFVVPWLGSVVVGTTDTTFQGEIDHPTVEDEDRRYCLDAVNSAFKLNLSAADISGAFAGLRPLIAGEAGETADLSRRHALYDIAPGITGITGGKLTTYRRMAKEAVDRVASDLEVQAKPRTGWIRLGSSDLDALRAALGRRAKHLGVSDSSLESLIRSYGDRSLAVLDLAVKDSHTEPLADGFAPVAAEAAYCIRYEMATHLGDLLARRTRLSLTDPAGGIGVGGRALDLMAEELGWDTPEANRQRDAYRLEVERERGTPLDHSVRQDTHAPGGARVG
jgi:glycerol-3-phosphate dehydrogenase